MKLTLVSIATALLLASASLASAELGQAHAGHSSSSSLNHRGMSAAKRAEIVAAYDARKQQEEEKSKGALVAPAPAAAAVPAVVPATTSSVTEPAKLEAEADDEEEDDDEDDEDEDDDEDDDDDDDEEEEETGVAAASTAEGEKDVEKRGRKACRKVKKGSKKGRGRKVFRTKKCRKSKKNGCKKGQGKGKGKCKGPKPKPKHKPDAKKPPAKKPQGGKTKDLIYKAVDGVMPMSKLITKCPKPLQRVQGTIEASAAAKGLQPQLLVAIAMQESTGCTNVYSNNYGCTQFSDENAWRAYAPEGKKDLKWRQDDATAIEAAANYMADLISKNDDSLFNALRAYNGPIAWGGKPTYQKEIEGWMRGEGNGW